MYITPCVQLCRVDKETGNCKGCGRSISQIKNWARYTDEQRLEIMKELGYGKRTSKEDKLVRKEARRRISDGGAAGERSSARQERPSSTTSASSKEREVKIEGSVRMVEETRKSITKELDVCHDCAEYGGHFCDDCLDEIKKFKENTVGQADVKIGKDSE